MITKYVNDKDFVIIDPPWNYPANKYLSDFWDDVRFMDIFQTITVPEVLIWTTADKLDALFNAHQESMYEFKALIPRIALMPNEDLYTSIDAGFRNPVEFLAVFRLPKVPQHNTHLTVRSIIIEPVNNLSSKPVRWEDRLIREMSEKGLSGMYLLPEGTIGYCDSIIQDTKKLQKKELF